MTAKSQDPHRPTLAVAVAPGGVDAGGAVSVTALASCPHGCDLGGRWVSIRDQDGAERARARLGPSDGQASVAPAVVVQAPNAVGAHTFCAVLDGDDAPAGRHAAARAPFSFATRAHEVDVSVFGVPGVVAAGERFALTVGVRCAAGCNLAGRPLRVVDREGALMAAAALRPEVWPGTTALYFVTVEATAARAAGDHGWRAEVPQSAGPPHAAGAAAFTVRVAPAPCHEVSVSAFDGAAQTPVAGATVVLHPYRGRTDGTGTARLKVARGRYRLRVSGFRYVPYEGEVDVAGDVARRVDLYPESEDSDDRHW